MNKLACALFYSSLLFMAAQVNAQKLPNVQTESLRAPANIKIDGKATEWNNKFQAYNKNTEVFYKLANDNEKLYLAVQATDEVIIKKIVMGGITLTIDPGNNRDAKNKAAITFPAYDINYPPPYFRFNKAKITNADSLMNVYNKTLSTKYKLISVSGIATVKDSLISLYNDLGIKIAAVFDKQLNYTCEITIPLKYLNLDNSKKFGYQLKINAATIDGRKLELVPGRNFVIYKGGDGNSYMLENQDIALVAPTDFWGEYTLAK